ncbi:MAG: alpha/beta fold hydrolase [Chloroflexota bacterium]
MIIFNHGYIDPEIYRTTERYVEYVNYFARSGYIVFRSDYRGHGDSEGQAGAVYSSPNYTIDVLNGLASIKTLPEADPNRIGMWGHSMGGYITLRSMVVSDEIKAGVIWGGVVGDYPDLFARDAAQATAVAAGVATPAPTRGLGGWRGALVGVYGAPVNNPDFWQSISSNGYLKTSPAPYSSTTPLPMTLSRSRHPSSYRPRWKPSGSPQSCIYTKTTATILTTTSSPPCAGRWSSSIPT